MTDLIAKRAEALGHRKKPWDKGLWDYALALYARPEVEALCLKLQDEYHANVNMMLWCSWLETERIELSQEVLDDVLIAIDTVSQSTVLKMREVRRFVKENQGFTRVQAQAIIKHLLNAELVVEKILLNRLQDLTLKFSETMPDALQPMDLACYLEFLHVKDAQKVAMVFATHCMEETEAF